MKVPPFLTAGLLLLAAAVPSRAAVYNYTFDITTPVPNPQFNIEGSVVGGVGGSPAGDGAFQSNITAGYNQLYIHLNVLFQRGDNNKLKMGDLASITYWTQASDPANGLDWAIRLYTDKKAGSIASWYDMRFEGKSPGASDSEWHEWDANTAGWFSGYNGAANVVNGKTLSDIAQDYANDDFLYFSFYAGASGNNKSIFNQIDYITVRLTNGDEVNIKLIPEPALFSLCAASWVAFALFRRKRSLY